MHTPQPTTRHTPAEAHALISNLEIAEPRFKAPQQARGNFKLAESDKPSADIDNGSLVSFVSNVSDDHRSCALNSALLSQLAADKKFNRFDDGQIMDWYKFYQTVMGYCGWTLQGFQFQNYDASGSTFSINEGILDIVAAFLPGDEVAVVKASLEALKNLSSDDPWYKVWDSNSHDAHGGNFQLSSCADTGGKRNSLVLRLSAYSFTTTETTTRFLWVDYKSSETHLKYAKQEVTLNEDVWDQVKEAVVQKLGDRAAQNINALDI